MRELVERNKAIVEAIQNGGKRVEIGAQHGITHERVSQIYQRHLKRCKIVSMEHIPDIPAQSTTISTPLEDSSHGA